MGRKSPAIAGDVVAALLGPAFGSWWDDLNKSPVWQHDVFYGLSAAYAAISAFALIQLIRIQMRVPGFRWTTQKLFLLMNFIVNSVRAAVFGFHAQIFPSEATVFTLVLFDLPGLLFFSTYTLLVLFWAEIYNMAINHPTEGLRGTYISINVLLYTIQIVIWIYIFLNDNYTVEIVGKLFMAVISLLGALGFLIYGGSLYKFLENFPLDTGGRTKKLKEVGAVTKVCLTCFLIRCAVAIGAAFDTELSLEVLNHPLLDLLYYLLTEIIPCALVLVILRKLPPKRVSVPPKHVSGPKSPNSL